MVNTEKALRQLAAIEDEAAMNTWIHRVHPMIKLLVTVAFLGVMLSFSRYDLAGVLLMSLYPFVLFALSAVNIRACIRRIGPVIPIFVLFGLYEMITDRTTGFTIGALAVSRGVTFALVLVIKGTLAVMAGYLYVATTGIENICAGLRSIHVPRILVTEILLVYRYFGLLAKEASELNAAYHLRTPRSKGIDIRHAGSFLGMLLLRSVDRAQVVYESMELRGYTGDFPVKRRYAPLWQGIVYALVAIALMVGLRIVI